MLYIIACILKKQTGRLVHFQIILVIAKISPFERKLTIISINLMLKWILFLQAMNQAQALSSVNYRILRTISLKKHFYITDIAYSERGIVCLSVVKQAFLTNEIMGGNDVKIVLPTGSYINYWQKKKLSI